MQLPAPRVFRESSESGWSEVTVRPPVAQLRGLVRDYTGYREDSRLPVRRREVPTGDVSLILSFGPRIGVVDSSARSGVRHGLTSFVVPVDDHWALTEYTGRQHGLQITLTPPGASRLLGLPLGELRHQVVQWDDVFGAGGRLLVERLAGLPDWGARFDALDRALLGWAARRRAPTPAAAWAWGRLTDTAGTLPIGVLVDELGCSHRWLLTEFRRHVGVAPKTFARVLRCRRAIRLLDRGVAPADVALGSGYSDQAHLNRDFRRLTGLTPAGWVRESAGSISSNPVPAGHS